MSRVIWIVIDSVGIGALPDAENFGDSKDVSTLEIYLRNIQISRFLI